jgi:hypothetical protein
MILIKQEICSFPSRYPNGVLMYPGQHVLTWAQVFPGIWRLVEMTGRAA